MNLEHSTAAELLARLARRELTAESLARACLERIDAREPEVQAWTHLDRAAVLAAAKELDRGAIRGALHGLPVGVKDVFDTFDLPTEYGSAIYARHRPAADAAVIALARSAGALVLGKTVTTEFATFPPGKTRNPHHPGHTPGGSSSGSAAAVAAAMVPVAFGTQTTGSIIRPASFCGAVGYKPSFGTLPRVGVKAISDCLDTVGVFARRVADAASFVGVLARRAFAVSAEVHAPRLGWCRTPQWPEAQPETRALFEREAARQPLPERNCASSNSPQRSRASPKRKARSGISRWRAALPTSTGATASASASRCAANSRAVSKCPLRAMTRR